MAAPSEQEWGDLQFAWRVCKFVRSNAIVLAANGATLIGDELIATDVTALEESRTLLQVALNATGDLIFNLAGHADGLNMAAFSADGSRIVTASNDKTARLWDAMTGAPLGEPMQHESRVHAAHRRWTLSNRTGMPERRPRAQTRGHQEERPSCHHRSPDASGRSPSSPRSRCSALREACQA